MKIIKPDWDIFKTNFHGNSQEIFEWFCYILFCKEFKKEKGIFRFKNQAAIETNTIANGNDIVGWQAKFYETTLSDHKKELLETLDKAKEYYPNITKILLYTNQEWGQNKGEDPKGLIEINQKAAELNITLIWYTASFFESHFVCVDNKIIAKHFFELDNSIFNLIEEQKAHTEKVFNGIQTGILFKENFIEINRNSDIEKITNTDQSVLVVSGVGGSGKTAMIKKIYEQRKEKIPFYLFKSTEFELRNLSDFFTGYSFQDFIDAHKDDNSKVIVIDSAEKLSDLRNTDPFKEFLSTIVTHNWKVIFTTRDDYLDYLNYHFFEIYKIAPLNINIKNVDIKELNNLSEIYNFSIPNDKKLLDILRNPFYLNEYLKYYNNGEQINYVEFKKRLWNKIIIKSKPTREQCFLTVAFQRATEGQFFVIPTCDASVLDDLRSEGVLGYESPHGYFITHDIYEEWSLEKRIDRDFLKKEDSQGFFDSIGQSLPMRRSFRRWVSEKLLLEDQEIKKFVEEVITDEQISQSWKNEILVSILLSDYSDYFFNIFSDRLLSNNVELLKITSFWLRIACKEVDDDEFFKQLGVKEVDLSILKLVLTKPRGNGWKSVIKFVFDKLEVIGIENINFILPVIYDWNSKFKTGDTTKFSSLIALEYYKWIIKEDVYFSRDEDIKEKLLNTIVYGSSEIKDELEEVFKEILKNKWKNYNDPYFHLSKTILNKLEGFHIYRVLPKYILELASLFWTSTKKKSNGFHSSRIDIGEEFEIENSTQDYYPASAYQTPIYWLLQSAQKETINFILDFTNKTIENFANSKFSEHEVHEIEVFLDENTTVKQYVSNRLWCVYRGTQVSPHILESIHMALEKFFIERGKNTPSETLEDWLIYLLRGSKSSSISAVVVSIVLAFPDKTFNVAKILFQTKDFFLYDIKRWSLDQTHKSQLLMFKNSFGLNSKNELHENDRLNACDESHRKWHLESLFLQYQVFRNKDVTEEEAMERQKVLWEILDNYYKNLPKEAEQTEEDKTWRFFLARMDYRQMKPTTTETDKGIEIQWNPTIDPKLKEESEICLKETSEPMEYISLKLWANYKINQDEKYKKYERYEQDQKLALKEVKEVISKLSEHTEDSSFHLLNYSIPAEVCAVLVKYHFDKLSQEDRIFCKDMVLDVASSSIRPNYQYQISDGVQSAISVLPLLLDQFPTEIDSIKMILFFILFDEYPIGMMGGNFNNFAIAAIHELWEDNFEDAQSLLLGYVLLNTKYAELLDRLRKENHQKGIYEFQKEKFLQVFFEENEADLQKIVDNQITMEDYKNIEIMGLSSLITVFLLIPKKIDNNDQKLIVKKTTSIFAEKLISERRNDNDRVDYMVKHNFLEKLSYFVLSAHKEDAKEYLKPFIDKFNSSEVFSDLFKEFILAEDQLKTNDKFWNIWDLFKEEITRICKDGEMHWYTKEIIKSYLFATVPWKDTATSWHALKEDNKKFFKEISQGIGHCPSVLYSIVKLLNNVGNPYLDDGIFWVSDILKKNINLQAENMEKDTIFYLENSVRKYVYKNREKIRKTKKIKESVLVILDFLIEKGSVVGYILRENIL